MVRLPFKGSDERAFHTSLSYLIVRVFPIQKQADTETRVLWPASRMSLLLVATLSSLPERRSQKFKQTLDMAKGEDLSFVDAFQYIADRNVEGLVDQWTVPHSGLLDKV